MAASVPPVSVGRLHNMQYSQVSKDINDLATSPVNSSIIASAADDTSVRIWSFDPVHKLQPCLCILAGEGHSWNLLSLVSVSSSCRNHLWTDQWTQSFHESGRYLLSAGHDQVINLVGPACLAPPSSTVRDWLKMLIPCV